MYHEEARRAALYATCLRCERSLGANCEIPHLPVGRRVAFDGSTGRIWVICRRCGQWNLMPIEERWEALEECERLALNAEAHVRGMNAGLACTESGLELLRVGGMPDEEIANWRYGRRLERRRRVVLWIAAMLGALAVLLGVLVFRGTGAASAGAWAALLAATWMGPVWRHPPLLVRLSSPGERPVRIWAWNLSDVQLREGDDGAAELLLAGRGKEPPLRGNPAARALAELLPKLNGAESALASIPSAVARVTRSEELATLATRQGRRKAKGRHGHEHGERVPRPWEHLVPPTWTPVIDLSAGTRLALEMAVTEEVERAELRECANELSAEWHDEEEVGAIADDLLVPPDVEKALRQADRQAREREMRPDEESPRKRRGDDH